MLATCRAGASTSASRTSCSASPARARSSLLSSGPSEMPGRFEGKVLLISGATGIAAATARLAMAEGAAVVAVARHSGGLEGVVLGDLTHPATARKTGRHCVDRYGRIDCLYNVAGMSARSVG